MYVRLKVSSDMATTSDLRSQVIVDKLNGTLEIPIAQTAGQQKASQSSQHALKILEMQTNM